MTDPQVDTICKTVITIAAIGASVITGSSTWMLLLLVWIL